MLVTTAFRTALSGLVLTLAAGAAQAQGAQDCQDATLAPTAQRGACDAAIEAATDPLEQARLLIQRAQTYRREQNMDGVDEVGADLAEAERLVPDMDPQLRVDLLVERSEISAVRGDFEAALADIEEAERLAPGDADPVINRGLVLVDQGDFEGASAQFARARELEPDHPRAHLTSMDHFLGLGDLEACVESGNKAVELAPADVRVWATRGLCLAELGRTEEALSDLAEAERLGPYLMTNYEDIAYAYLVLDRPEDVLATARRAVEMDPMHEGARALLTIGLVETGAVDEAIAAYREAQTAGIEDDTGLMANELAFGLYMAGEHEKALPIIEEGLARQTEPAAGDIDTLAHILAALGRTDEAVEAFRRAAEIGGPEIRSMYEDQLTALGHTPEPGEEGFEAALRACVATGEACKLFPQ
jgi:tetratricopeptide (TPR) repeat protein